jgi:hypothetical protein
MLALRDDGLTIELFVAGVKPERDTGVSHDRVDLLGRHSAFRRATRSDAQNLPGCALRKA